jgi:Putative translation initiation inhibitor, yjgF family
MAIEHVNPESMHSHPAYSQGTIAPAGRTLYVGGQNGVDAHGELVEGPDAQVAQAMRNVLTVLESAGATQADVAKLTIYLHESLTGESGFAAALPVWGRHPTAITVVRVPSFARPGVLCEIEAIAALP